MKDFIVYVWFDDMYDDLYTAMKNNKAHFNLTSSRATLT